MADPLYTDEEWRAIAHSPAYEVSSLGRVRRVTCGTGTYPGRILKANPSGPPKSRYWGVALSMNGKPRTRKVHVLVAEAFHGPRPTSLHHAAHNDGDKSNNRADNIRWATPTENQFDAQRHGTVWSKLSATDVAEIRASDLPTVVLAARYNVNRSTIRKIVTRKNWRAF